MAEEPKETKAGSSSSHRDYLSWWIITISALGTLGLGIAVMLIDRSSAGEVFGTLVPLFGTWVGTILAFYFSRENFESANRGVLEAFGQMTGEERLRQSPVRTAMIRRAAIIGIDAKGRPDEEIPLGEVCEVLKRKSRVIIFEENGSLRYVVHDAMVYKYIADQAIDRRSLADPATVTLKDLLVHPLDGDTIGAKVRKVAYISVDATLADARDKMVATNGGKDVIVTRTGTAGEPLEGWITDVDIARYAQVT